MPLLAQKSAFESKKSDCFQCPAMHRHVLEETGFHMSIQDRLLKECHRKTLNVCSAKSSPLLPRANTTILLYKYSMETFFDTSQELQLPIPNRKMKSNNYTLKRNKRTEKPRERFCQFQELEVLLQELQFGKGQHLVALTPPANAPSLRTDLASVCPLLERESHCSAHTELTGCPAIHSPACVSSFGHCG